MPGDIWFEPKQDNLHQPHLFASLIGRVSAEETSALDHFVFKMIVSPAFCPHSSRSFQTVSGTFDSAFAVLFNFRSCYLSTIGLPTIFSFGSMLPAVFDHYSQSSRLSRRVENFVSTVRQPVPQGYHLLWRSIPTHLPGAAQSLSPRHYIGLCDLFNASCALFTRRY